MLAVASRAIKDEREGGIKAFPIGIDEFPDFSDGNLLDNIIFDDLFMGIDGGDVFPDLEMDPDMFAGFSSSGGEESEMNTSSFERIEESSREEMNTDSINLYNQGEEILSKRDELVSVDVDRSQKGEKGKKTSSKNSQGKRKVKVDWTPELHRRFVQAVEQLGVDKAVPSRILELMGIHCLTRHNIASHLQKYRSHRKHLLAREAEAASWGQRRRNYRPTSAMGFPPTAPPPMPHFRPLHVWGHPSMDQSMMQKWPKHLVPPHSPSSPLATWVPLLPYPRSKRNPPDPAYWNRHHQGVPNPLPVTPCFPHVIPTARFPSPPVMGIPPPPSSQPQAMYRPTAHQPPFDFHPSKESIDAAIGDVLAKPWSPLPLGLKPPSVDGVLVELQRQGVSNIPPSNA